MHRLQIGLLVAMLQVATPGAQAKSQSSAQTALQPLRLEQAIDLALQNYPALKIAAGHVQAAQAGVDLARTTYLPRLDVLWQDNLATRNNVAGLLLPQSVISSITGPVSPTTYGGVWGSAAGALFSWEPFDFGWRRANVDVAESLVKQAATGVDVTRLQVATAAADVFLTAVAADQTVHAAEANVDRLQVVSRAVAVLVQNQLRPGADASRTDAEVAAAKIQLIQAQRVADRAHLTLAEMVGFAGQRVAVDGAPLLHTLPGATETAPDVAANPLVAERLAAVDLVKSRELALSRSYQPKVNLQSSLFARGAPPAGTTAASAGQLVPDTSNWAVGLTLTFPVFDVFNVRAHRAIEFGNEAVARAEYDQTVQAIQADRARALSDLDAAKLIAATTPVALQAAQQAESQVRARYDAGLATLTEVADVERLLAQAEIDDGLARLGVWRAWLADATAAGSLATFLSLVKAAPIHP